MILRDAKQKIEKWLGERAVIVLYGARQVGKTTLLKMIFDTRQDTLMLNCERPNIKELLSGMELPRIASFFGDNNIIILDEAQTIDNIGQVLKLIYDELPQYKVIATGSSAFGLSEKVTEPLTGRNIKLPIYPLSINELSNEYGWHWVEENLHDLLVYGMYPGIITEDPSRRQARLQDLAADYLYKDILAIEGYKNSKTLHKLLKAVALQCGSVVSVNELSNLLGISWHTVARYLDLLEQTFVIVNLPSFGSNSRNELKKQSKYVFIDNGIRNSVINNFLNLDNRQDTGQLWENFCIAERMKANSLLNPSAKLSYWRTYDGAEIDLIEETGEQLHAIEFKYGRQKNPRLPASFAEKYKPAGYTIISPGNLYQWKI